MPTTTRVDPLKTFRFRVRYSDSLTPFLGVSKVTGIKRTTEVIKHRCGGDPATSFKYPGKHESEAIMLERGVAVNALEFEKWANKVWSITNSSSGRETSLKDFRRDIVIDIYDEAGQKVLSYQVFNCWVSEYAPIGELDANGNAILIQSIKLENEGWRRDRDVVAPTEVQFDDPAGVSLVGAGTAATMLRAWEDGGAIRGVARAVALAALAGPSDPDAMWDLPLGTRNALLGALRERWFGTTVACTAACPGCAEELDVEFELAELPLGGPSAPQPVIDGAGGPVPVRPVTSRDLAMAQAAAEPRRRLVLGCLLGQSDAMADAVEAAVLSAAGPALAAADPAADLSMELSCACCGHVWSAQFDLAEQLWSELDSYARRLLLDVHRLARAYGWREPDVLALSSHRRQYYLDLVEP